MEIFLTLLFWKMACLVAGLGGIMLLPFLLGVIDSRRRNKEWLERLDEGFYLEFNQHVALTQTDS